MRLSLLRNAALSLLQQPEGQCVICNEPDIDGWLCEDCYKTLDFPTEPLCPRCGKPLLTNQCYSCASWPDSSPGIPIKSAVLYNDTAAFIVHSFKYRRQFDMASAITDIIQRRWHEMRQPTANVTLVPVPLHPKRLRERTFNQSAIICDLLEIEGLGTVNDCLRRVRATPSQVTLGSEDRWRNVENAFRLKPKTRINGNRILLVDDVCTTGATLQHCAAALYAEGFTNVSGLTFATVGHMPPLDIENIQKE